MHRARRALLAALLTAGAGLVYLSVAPQADAAEQCSITGSIGGPNPAYVGQTLSARAAVAPSAFGSCTARTMAIVSNSDGRQLNSTSCPVTHGSGTCTAFFLAYPGLHTVSAVLSTGQTATLGTFTVIDEPPPTSGGKTSQPAPPPATHTVTASARATASTSAAKTSTSRTPSRSATTWLPNFGGDDSSTSSAAAAAAASPSSAPPLVNAGVAVVHGSGSVSIPWSLLLVTLLVLGGVGAAATRMIYRHTRTES